MGQEKKEFRFLSDHEFLKLPGKEKAIYLSVAAQELEHRQRKLREQMQQLDKEQQPDD